MALPGDREGLTDIAFICDRELPVLDGFHARWLEFTAEFGEGGNSQGAIGFCGLIWCGFADDFYGKSVPSSAAFRCPRGLNRDGNLALLPGFKGGDR